MQTRRRFLLSGSAAAVAAVAGLAQWRMAQAVPPGAAGTGAAAVDGAGGGASYAVTHTDAQWHQLLNDKQYAVLRRAGTEWPYSSPLNDEHRNGVFACAGCKLDAFSSHTKFDSHTGWPSFWEPLAGAVATSSDSSLNMNRTEVHCTRCGSHLGHVFDDGPKPTGLRYCMNGLALQFTPA